MSGKAPKQYLKAEKIFTDRVEPRAAFSKMVRDVLSNPTNIFVLSFYGIGGIGKTKLLEVLSNNLTDAVFHIKYDFRDSTKPREVIFTIRNLLVQKGFDFILLDNAEDKYTQKSGKPSLKQSLHATNIEDNAFGGFALEGVEKIIPGASLVTKGINASKETVNIIKTFFTEKSSEYSIFLNELETLDAQQIEDALPEYFAKDLEFNITKKGKPLIIMLDTYEKLVDTYSEIGYSSTSDHWLREKIVDMVPGVMWVIAGRERLDWAQKDETWEGMIDEHRLGDLSPKDSTLFLETAKIPQNLWNPIYELTGGTPAFLDLCVEQYYKFKKDGYSNITIEMLAGKNGKKEELLERFVRYMDTEIREISEIQAMFEIWNNDCIETVCRNVYGRFNNRLYQETLQHSIIYTNNYGRYYMHDLVKKVIVDYTDKNTKKKIFLEIIKVLFNDINLVPFEYDLSRCFSKLPEIDLSLLEFVELYEKSQAFPYIHSQILPIFLDKLKQSYMDENLLITIHKTHSCLLDKYTSLYTYIDIYLYEILNKYYGEKNIHTLNYMHNVGELYSTELDFYTDSEFASANEKKQIYTTLACQYLEKWYITGKEILGYDNLTFINQLGSVICLYNFLGNEKKVFEIESIRLNQYKILLGEKDPTSILEYYFYGYFLENYNHAEQAKSYYMSYINEMQNLLVNKLCNIKTDEVSRHFKCTLGIVKSFCLSEDMNNLSLSLQLLQKLYFIFQNAPNISYRDKYNMEKTLLGIIDFLSSKNCCQHANKLQQFNDSFYYIDPNANLDIMDICELRISPDIIFRLSKAGITTVRSLCNLTYTEFMNIEKLGYRSKQKLLDLLKKNGIELRNE